MNRMTQSILETVARLPLPSVVESWLCNAVEKHAEAERLVVEIATLSDRHTAAASLWLARALWLRGDDINATLRAVKRLLLAG